MASNSPGLNSCLELHVKMDTLPNAQHDAPKQSRRVMHDDNYITLRQHAVLKGLTKLYVSAGSQLASSCGAVTVAAAPAETSSATSSLTPFVKPASASPSSELCTSSSFFWKKKLQCVNSRMRFCCLYYSILKYQIPRYEILFSADDINSLQLFIHGFNTVIMKACINYTNIYFGIAL